MTQITYGLCVFLYLELRKEDLVINKSKCFT